MAKQDIKNVVDNRLISIDRALADMTPGTEDFSRAVKDISLLASASAEIQKVAVQAEDNEAKREEQKRVNDEEIEIKKTQLLLDTKRANNEQDFKARQLKQDLMKIFVDSSLGAFAQIGYFGMTRRVMKTEYRLTEGSSVLPPNGVKRALDDLKPKKRF